MSKVSVPQGDSNVCQDLKSLVLLTVVIVRARALDMLSGLCEGGLKLAACIRAKGAGINSKALVLVEQSSNQVINLVMPPG